MGPKRGKYSVSVFPNTESWLPQRGAYWWQVLFSNERATKDILGRLKIWQCLQCVICWCDYVVQHYRAGYVDFSPCLRELMQQGITVLTWSSHMTQTRPTVFSNNNVWLWAVSHGQSGKITVPTKPELYDHYCVTSRVLNNFTAVPALFKRTAVTQTGTCCSKPNFNRSH